MMCLIFPVHSFGTIARSNDSRLATHDISNQRTFASGRNMWKFSCLVQRNRQRVWMECNTGIHLDHQLNQSFTSTQKITNGRYTEENTLYTTGYSRRASFLPDIYLLSKRKQVFASKSTKLFLSTEVETSSTETSTLTSNDTEKNGSNKLNFVFTESKSVSQKSITPKEKHLKSDENEKNASLYGVNNNRDDLSIIHDEKPQPTANGGFSHTSSSKAKISQANKGKVPWNKGRKRSEADKARISAGVRAKNRERLLKKIAEMGLTEDEYNAKLEKEKNEIAEEKAKRKTSRGGYTPTAETKAKISKILMEKHRKGEIKKRTINRESRKGKKHSDETKKKISESLKARWSDDPEYKQNIKSKIKESNSSEDVRARISNTLKEKWKDPEFRAYMMDKMAKRKPPSNNSRGDEYRKKISESMKKKWEDPNYRAKALDGMQTSNKKRTPSVRKKKVSSGLKKKKKKKKKVTVEAVMLEPAIKTSPAPEEKKATNTKSTSTTTPKKKKRKNRKKKKKNQPTSDSTSLPSSLIVENSEEKKRVSKMKDERRDLYDLLYGEEEREEQQHNLDLSSDSTNDEDFAKKISHEESSIKNDYTSLFEDDEEDFNIDDFDPYGLDELEQQRF